MIKHLKILLVNVVAIFAITGCQKEVNWNNRPIPNANGCKLITTNTDLGLLGKYTLNYTYDASGRLSTVTSDGEKKTYSYTATEITGSVNDEKTVLKLVNGRVVSSTYMNSFVVNEKPVLATKEYTYSAEGYISIVKSYLDKELNSIVELTYTNGNLAQTKTTYPDDATVEIETYEYSDQVLGNPIELADPLALVVDYMPGGYYGRRSKNAVKKSTERSNGSSDIVVSDYTYQFDANGNATSIVIETATILSDGTKAYESSISADLVYSCSTAAAVKPNTETTDPSAEYYLSYKVDGVQVVAKEFSAIRDVNSPRSITVTGSAKDGKSPKFKYFLEEPSIAFTKGLNFQSSSYSKNSHFMEYTNSSGLSFSTKTGSAEIWLFVADLSFKKDGFIKSTFNGTVETEKGVVVQITEGKFSIKFND
ncbi:DUF4595 domain-containing protein [Pedobacter endophyticus]|uniref:DUF4595 domain-containing protein n=1 Tax=Pedobacter endophyticus TaxID=2789740 RepID=A0A7S9L382_9SPHI|nr:DUF4595 domain-containing protein [Pedobacter endophyticus]QPH41667.1 DUF4595 domain-containing protein [Pedobacter endophyticus]